LKFLRGIKIDPEYHGDINVVYRTEPIPELLEHRQTTNTPTDQRGKPNGV
jgi:hypothetical protein